MLLQSGFGEVVAKYLVFRFPPYCFYYVSILIQNKKYTVKDINKKISVYHVIDRRFISKQEVSFLKKMKLFDFGRVQRSSAT